MSAAEERYGECPCGNAWFHLLPFDDEGDGDLPVVCIDTAGEITGYAGKLCCSDCGQRWSRPGAGVRHLRLAT